ncbi:MAG TPA: hotdog fold thioesterase [Chitinophagaceae bacterium]|nr:hotdog fold thioesterase [Chitinophagaceae bacterium]
MSIWFRKDLSADLIRNIEKNSMGEFLGIEWVDVGDDYITARMPVTDRTRQPYGLLHGGASCALAESIGSIASAMVVDHDRFACVGLEINANHVKSASEGFVTGTARPLHLGSNTHVWDIRIYNEGQQLVCVSRLTVAIIPRKQSFRRSSL